MLANCAITNIKTISPFIDSSIDIVMLQTNPDFTSRFLNFKTFLTSYGRHIMHDKSNFVIDWLLEATDQNR